MRHTRMLLLTAAAVLTGILIAASMLTPAAQPAAANQSGPGVNDQLTGWAILCQLHGGKATVDTSARTVNGLPHGSFTCNGGHLGGLSCYLDSNPAYNMCRKKSAALEPEPGNWANSNVDPSTLPLVPLVPVPATAAVIDIAETPMVLDAQVVFPASDGVVQGIQVANIHTCKLGGGEEVVSSRLPDQASAITIRCDGGVFDAHVCDAVAGVVSCFNEGTATVVEQPSEEGEMAGNETTVPEPTTAPTLAPTEAAQPTEPPVVEPTFAPTDAGPWTVPEGTLPVFEPAEPTPTEVILT